VWILKGVSEVIVMRQVEIVLGGLTRGGERVVYIRGPRGPRNLYFRQA
jgi:hypothetical protein